MSIPFDPPVPSRPPEPPPIPPASNQSIYHAVCVEDSLLTLTRSLLNGFLNSLLPHEYRHFIDEYEDGKLVFDIVNKLRQSAIRNDGAGPAGLYSILFSPPVETDELVALEEGADLRDGPGLFESQIVEEVTKLLNGLAPTDDDDREWNDRGRESAIQRLLPPAYSTEFSRDDIRTEILRNLVDANIPPEGKFQALKFDTKQAIFRHYYDILIDVPGITWHLRGLIKMTTRRLRIALGPDPIQSLRFLDGRAGVTMDVRCKSLHAELDFLLGTLFIEAEPFRFSVNALYQKSGPIATLIPRPILAFYTSPRDVRIRWEPGSLVTRSVLALMPRRVYREWFIRPIEAKATHRMKQKMEEWLESKDWLFSYPLEFPTFADTVDIDRSALARKMASIASMGLWERFRERFILAVTLILGSSQHRANALDTAVVSRSSTDGNYLWDITATSGNSRLLPIIDVVTTAHTPPRNLFAETYVTVPEARTFPLNSVDDQLKNRLVRHSYGRRLIDEYHLGTVVFSENHINLWLNTQFHRGGFDFQPLVLKSSDNNQWRLYRLIPKEAREDLQDTMVRSLDVRVAWRLTKTPLTRIDRRSLKTVFSIQLDAHEASTSVRRFKSNLVLECDSFVAFGVVPTTPANRKSALFQRPPNQWFQVFHDLHSMTLLNEDHETIAWRGLGESILGDVLTRSRWEITRIPFRETDSYRIQQYSLFPLGIDPTQWNDATTAIYLNVSTELDTGSRALFADFSLRGQGESFYFLPVNLGSKFAKPIPEAVVEMLDLLTTETGAALRGRMGLA